MELTYYFDPVSLKKPDNYFISKANFGKNIFIHTQNNTISNLDFQLVLLGVPEDRNAVLMGTASAPDLIRTQLYQLSRIAPSLRIADFGNLKNGKTVEDTYYALRDVMVELLTHDIIPVILGGSQDLTYAGLLAYKKLQRAFNLLAVDSRIDVGNSKSEFNAATYLNRIIHDELLLHFANIGTQGYFVSEGNKSLLEKMHFDLVRLGTVRQQIWKVEPLLRDGNMVSVDFSSVRQSDAPASAFPSPNGFYSEDICQIARYAGLSNANNVFGVYNILPEKDINSQTVHLAAQVIWFYMEGYHHRVREDPDKERQQLHKFIVNPEKIDHALTFYKSAKSGRWWMEVPVFSDKQDTTGRLISCDYEDYQEACNNHIPDRWWKAFRRLNG